MYSFSVKVEVAHHTNFLNKIAFIFLTAACCPKRDYYTHTPPLKTATDFCTANSK